MSLIDTHDMNNSLLRGTNHQLNIMMNDHCYRSKISQSFIIDLQNVKQLQIIQCKAVELKQKQKKYRTYFLKLKKLFEQRKSQFLQYEKKSIKQLSQKSNQIKQLTVKNKALKQYKNQYENLKDQRDILQMKNQQLQQQNIKLTNQLQKIQSQHQQFKHIIQNQQHTINNIIHNVNIQQKYQPLGSFSDTLNQIKKSRRKMSDLIKVQDLQRIQQITKFQSNIQYLTQQLQQKNYQIDNYKTTINNYQKQRINKQQNENQRKQNNFKNYTKLQTQLLKVFQIKTLKQHSQIYGAFSVTTKQIFKNLKNQNSQNNQNLFQNILKIIQSNIIKLNDHFKSKAKNDIQVINKMMGYMKNAGQVIKKTQYQTEKDSFNNISSPQRINFNQLHSRQLSNSSVSSSLKKSIVLEQDLQNAISQNFDKVKQQTLQATMDQLKQSKLIEDHIDQGHHQSSLNENKSDESASKSKRSGMSQAEKQIQFKKNEKSAKLKGKLKNKNKNR